MSMYTLLQGLLKRSDAIKQLRPFRRQLKLLHKCIKPTKQTHKRHSKRSYIRCSFCCLESKHSTSCLGVALLSRAMLAQPVMQDFGYHTSAALMLYAAALVNDIQCDQTLHMSVVCLALSLTAMVSLLLQRQECIQSHQSLACKYACAVPARLCTNGKQNQPDQPATGVDCTAGITQGT